MSTAILAARSLSLELGESHAAPARPAVTGRFIEFDVVTTRAGFDALEADWTALFERAASSTHVFQTFNWLWHWCNHYLPASGGKMSLYIVTARSEGRLVMVWPLVRQRTRGLTVLSWMGEPVSQYGDVLVEAGPDAAGMLDRAWRYIARTSGADLLRLRKVRADAAVAPLMTKLKSRITEELAAPYLDLKSAGDFTAYEQRYSGGARRNRRRLFRRLDEQGKISFEEHTSGPEARALIQVAVDLKRKWLHSRGLVSKAYADDRFTHFFADVAGADERPAGCRVAAIKTAGRPVAIEVAIGCGDRMALHIVVFDLDYEKSGAGVLLIEQCIRNAANSGVGCYDLLAPADDYKMGWADGTVAVCDHALALSVTGRAYAEIYLGLVRGHGKKLIDRLPAGPRRHVASAVSRLLKKS